MSTQRTSARSVLRLVDGDARPRAVVPAQSARVRVTRPDAHTHTSPETLKFPISRDAEVAAEMRAAAQLSSLDARWILAVQVSRSLCGGRAAILPPEHRRRLMTLGERFSLRPFDSSLVIAVVQDAARAGEDELGRDVVARLSMIRQGRDPFPGHRPRWTDLLIRAAVITAGAVALAFVMVRWIAM